MVIGGSYGGYMAGYLGSRHGEIFKGAIMLNPCLNFPFMLNITDIPDWMASSVLNKHHDWNYTEAEYKKLFEMSPQS